MEIKNYAISRVHSHLKKWNLCELLSYAVVFGKKIQTFAAKVLGIKTPDVFSPSKEITNKNQGLTAVEKIFNKNIIDKSSGKVLICRF